MTKYLDYEGLKKYDDKIKAMIDAWTKDVDTVAYGVEFDTTISSPTCTRIGNMTLHKTLPIHSRMKGCLLDDDGNVVEYLSASEWDSNPPALDVNDLRVFLPNGDIEEACPVRDAFPVGMWQGECSGVQPSSWQDILDLGILTEAPEADYYYIYQISDPSGDQCKVVYYDTDDTYQELNVEDTTAKYFVVVNPNSYGGEASTESGLNLYQHLFSFNTESTGTIWEDMGYFNGRRDGLRGQVMMEIPEYYRRFDTEDTKRRVYISTVDFAGAHRVPKMYVSAYEAALDRTNQKLASVVNTSTQYRGGDNNANYDGTYRTFLGRPASAISRTNFRAYARKRRSGSTEWNCMTYDAHKALYWLFVVEYATLNSQATYTAELTTEGYHQGGLGDGVTNWSGTQWDTFNGRYPFVPCGHTDSLGNGTGTVAYTAQNDDASISKTSYVPRYRGIENPFGHLWLWMDGINVRISPNTDNGGDGLSKVFVCSDPSKFNDSNYEGYSHVGNEARTEGFVKEVIFGEGGEIMPKEVGGSSTTYFCDDHWTAIPTTEALRGVFFGGDAYDGAYAGIVRAGTGSSISEAHTNVGTRLCFIPNE